MDSIGFDFSSGVDPILALCTIANRIDRRAVNPVDTLLRDLRTSLVIPGDVTLRANDYLR